MGVDVYRNGENGEQLEFLADASGILARLIDLARKSGEFPLLKYVDPFGDTLFNRLQLPEFVEECRRLLTLTAGAEETEFIHHVIAIGERADEQIDYVLLVGD